MHDLEPRLEELRAAGLERRLRCVSERDGSRVVVDGRPVTLLCSNDYLGLADDPRVQEAAAEAALAWGAGAGASRLISGNLALHSELEAELADFKGYERCVLFGSGYLANTGIVAALAGRGATVLSDELNHASIIDGCRLARAQTVVYRHADLEHLEHELRRAVGSAPLIVTDGVFSMDGDVAPLAGIVELARRYGARVMVDEAHATGALGPGGRGSVAAAGLGEEVDVVVGTLGKTLGAYGAYACCDATTTDWLVNTARTLIFSTALPPPAVGAARAALAIVRREPERVERLRRNAAVLRDALVGAGLAVGGGPTQIVPLVIGEADLAVRACEGALAGGVFAQAIRPPTVPAGTSRLRLAAMATHTGDELHEAARVVAGAVSGARAGRGPDEVGAPAGGRDAARDGPAAGRRLGAGRRGWAQGRGRVRARMRGLFVTGTDTGAGKSVVAAAICAALAARGERVAAFKPAVTGLADPPGEWPHDHELLATAASAGQAPSEVAPYRFGPAVSPHLAAELAGERVERAHLVAAADRAACEADLLVVEGVGGLLVPLSLDCSVRDLAADLGLPVVVAARPGLGTISHTLLTVEAARVGGLTVAGVVLTPWPAAPGRLERSNRDTIERLAGVRVSGLLWTSPASLAEAGSALPIETWLGEAGASTARGPVASAA